ncbi:MAG: DUF3299 domain-containing protein [Bacteroidetes bacterium]|nr:DUF3299 domain-containing protein [Bacteroidota bacterium]MCH8522961.1 DUF3299 domain-containing protein [Balneolales bacterium]
MKYLALSLFLVGVLFSQAEAKTNGNSTIASSVNSASVATEANANSVTRLYFKDLRTWRMGASEAPADLKQHNGQIVSIVGYMVPFDSIEKIDRFILLQAPFMGCFHVPPPQPNETLMINSMDVQPDYVYEPIRITGKLTIEETYVDRFLVSLYTIDAIRIETVRMDDAELDDLPANFHFYSEF